VVRGVFRRGRRHCPTYNGRHVMHVLLVVLAMVLVVAAVILAVVILRL
jgi:hypothetical protein